MTAELPGRAKLPLRALRELYFEEGELQIRLRVPLPRSLGAPRLQQLHPGPAQTVIPHGADRDLL